jgi:hypothetical protein
MERSETGWRLGRTGISISFHGMKRAYKAARAFAELA